jgi:hypothetical protein
MYLDVERQYDQLELVLVADALEIWKNVKPYIERRFREL